MNDEQLHEEILAELTGNILPFWRECVLDEAGQFIGQMDAEGRIVASSSHGLILCAARIGARLGIQGEF